MPYRDLARYNVDGTIRSLHEVEAMDFRNLALFNDWVDLNIRGIHTQIARLEGYQDG